MPIKIRKLPGIPKWRVYEGHKIKSYSTSKKNALKQVRLLRGIEHGMVLRKK